MRKYRKDREREFVLEIIVGHLESLAIDPRYMSYMELSQYIHKVYTRDLAPLRQEYRDGLINERMHTLLTQGYKAAKEICMSHCIPWPPPADHCIYEKRLVELVRSFENIEEQLQVYQDKVERLKNELAELKKFRKWSNQSK